MRDKRPNPAFCGVECRARALENAHRQCSNGVCFGTIKLMISDLLGTVTIAGRLGAKVAPKQEGISEPAAATASGRRRNGQLPATAAPGSPATLETRSNGTRAWPPSFQPCAFGALQACEHPFPDALALELGGGAENMHLQLPRWCRRVNPLGQTDERDSQRPQLLEQSVRCFSSRSACWRVGRNHCEALRNRP